MPCFTWPPVARTDDGAVAVIADACQTWWSTLQRSFDALVAEPRLRHRRLLSTILEDVACGAYSALERRHLVRVERPHGLPTGQRQRRVSIGKSIAYRHVEYLALSTSWSSTDDSATRPRVTAGGTWTVTWTRRWEAC